MQNGVSTNRIAEPPLVCQNARIEVEQRTHSGDEIGHIVGTKVVEPIVKLSVLVID